MHMSWVSRSLPADCVFLFFNAFLVQLSSTGGGNNVITQLKLVVNERNKLYSNSTVWRQYKAFANNIYQFILKFWESQPAYELYT